MSSSRIIRPSQGRALPSDEALEFNFHNIEELSRQIIREAMERLDEMNARRDELEAEIERRKDSLEEELAGHRQELEAGLEATRAEIDSIREQAHREGFEKGREEARQEGYDEGYQEGFAQGATAGRETGHREAHEAETRRIQEETEFLVATVKAFAHAISTGRSEMLQAARGELVSLAVKIAERILHREIEDDLEVIRRHVSEALELAFGASRVVVQVHPRDAEVIQSHVGGLLETLEKFEEFEVQACEDVTRGGCRILTGRGEVDLTLETQLAQIEARLLEVARGEHTERIDGISAPTEAASVESELASAESEPETVTEEES